ncbi:MAG TPA: TauD/TfdA family dioxygenase [Ktedonobacteraceae bacterium]|nr:TauD/TfdA family dioxygenase [Ktedonobacteraceae bacterium]
MITDTRAIQREQTFSPYCDHLLELTNEERSLIEAALDGLPPINVCASEDDLITEVELRSRCIPDRLARRLINFRKNSNENGMLLIRNLPIDQDLPPTPEDGGVSHEKRSHLSEYVLLAQMLHLGEPIAYADEKNGALIQNICPVRGKEEAQENCGSAYLEFHTEDAFHPHKPDFIGLLCLKSDHDHIAATAAASIRRALSLVPSKAQEILRQPLYRIRLSSSFMADATQPVFSECLSVLSGDMLEPDLSVDFYGMEAMTHSAQLALKTLEEALLKVAVECRLMKGDLMIVDNRVAAHARTAFHPRHDGQDRWLQRLFVVHDFRKSKASRPRDSHICTPLPIEFSGRYLEK